MEVRLDKSNLIRIEKGRTNPTALTLRRLANALEMPMHELMVFGE